MKIIKYTIICVLIQLLFFYVYAQKTSSFYPFKGFHLSFTGQAEFIQKSIFINDFFASDPAPIGVVTYGWEAGIEFSYHFSKYMGISLGFNVGTVMSYDCDIFLTTVPDFEGGWKERNEYERYGSPINVIENIIPIKLEFHYPLSKYLFFTVEAGVKMKGIFNRIAYGKNKKGRYGRSITYLTFPPYTQNDSVMETTIYEDWGYREISKIRCDLLLGIGFYYKLPYGDLLRFTAGVNIAFCPDIKGYYRYYASDIGTFTIKNDFIYTQLSYIHTFNWQKARKYLRKNEINFSSKKERWNKVIEMLDVL